MCTAVGCCAQGRTYFGRTLDVSKTYTETVTVMPRRFPLAFRQAGEITSHYAIIGIAYVSDGYPLYYDAANEKGLAMAGLHFPHNAVYGKAEAGKDAIAPFELLPWVLGQCATMAEAEVLLERLSLIDTPFRENLPLAPLHWFLTDGKKSLTIEATAAGLTVYDNPVGVLTNNPPFPFHLAHLTHFMNLTPEPPENRFSDRLDLTPFCCGMGAMGLPGDASSPSRFVRAAFTAHHADFGTAEGDGVTQMFHIMGAVEMQRGCVHLEDGGLDRTVYTVCCDLQAGVYYYTTYENRRITAVDLHKEPLGAAALSSYPLRQRQDIFRQNG